MKQLEAWARLALGWVALFLAACGGNLDGDERVATVSAALAETGGVEVSLVYAEEREPPLPLSQT